jgi:hypothetical protein
LAEREGKDTNSLLLNTFNNLFEIFCKKKLESKKNPQKRI